MIIPFDGFCTSTNGSCVAGMTIFCFVVARFVLIIKMYSSAESGRGIDSWCSKISVIPAWNEELKYYPTQFWNIPSFNKHICYSTDWPTSKFSSSLWYMKMSMSQQMYVTFTRTRKENTRFLLIFQKHSSTYHVWTSSNSISQILLRFLQPFLRAEHIRFSYHWMFCSKPVRQDVEWYSLLPLCTRDRELKSCENRRTRKNLVWYDAVHQKLLIIEDLRGECNTPACLLRWASKCKST